GPASEARTSPPSDFFGMSTRFVGRAAEAQRLIDVALDCASERRAEIVTLVGAAGLGRTRVLAEVGGALAPDGFLVIGAPCPALAGSASYRLAALLLRAQCHVLEDDPPEVVRSKLVRSLDNAAGAELEDVVATLTTILVAQGPPAPDSIAPSDAWSYAKNRVA